MCNLVPTLLQVLECSEVVLVNRATLGQPRERCVERAAVAVQNPLVRRQLFLRIDDNYFSRSTTITPCPAGGAKRRCQTSLEMSPLAASRRPRGFIHKIGFFLAAAGGRGGRKVGILVLDFHFSTAHNSRFFACLLFCLRHVTPAISTALPPSGFSWWRRPPPHSPSAWLSAC